MLHRSLRNMTLSLMPPDELIGSWWVECDDNDYLGIIIIDSKGRVVLFETTDRRLPLNEVIKLWCSVDDSKLLRFSPSPFGRAWVRLVAKTDEGFSIFTEGKAYPMRKADRSDFPEWLDSDYASAIECMVEKESDC